MDRGPARASDRLGFRDQPRDYAARRRSPTTAVFSRSIGIRSKTVGAHLRAPEPATLYRMHGNLTGAYDIRHVDSPQPRRRHQQDADRIKSRLRRSAGVFRAGASDAADRDRTGSRSARCHHAQSRRRRTPFPTGRRAERCSIPAIIRKRSGAAVHEGALAELKARRDAARARRPTLRHRLCRRGRAQRLQYGLHHDRADAGRAPQGRPEERRPGDRDDRDRSGRRASPCTSPRCRKGRGIVPSCRRSSPTCSGLTPSDIRVNTEIDTAKDAWSIASGNYCQPFRRRPSPAPPSSPPSALPASWRASPRAS